MKGAFRGSISSLGGDACFPGAKIKLHLVWGFDFRAATQLLEGSFNSPFHNWATRRGFSFCNSGGSANCGMP
jgi:hypothetical protein